MRRFAWRSWRQVLTKKIEMRLEKTEDIQDHIPRGESRALTLVNIFEGPVLRDVWREGEKNGSNDVRNQCDHFKHEFDVKSRQTIAEQVAGTRKEAGSWLILRWYHLVPELQFGCHDLGAMDHTEIHCANCVVSNNIVTIVILFL